MKNIYFVKFHQKSRFPVFQPQNDSFSIGFIRGGEKGAKSDFFSFPRALKMFYRAAVEHFRVKNWFSKIFAEFIDNRIAKPMR